MLAFFWYDILRYITITHGVVLTMFIMFGLMSYRDETTGYYISKTAVKFRMCQLLSYLIAILFMTVVVIHNIGRPEVTYYAPAALICWILGDIGFYYKFKNRDHHLPVPREYIHNNNDVS